MEIFTKENGKFKTFFQKLTIFRLDDYATGKGTMTYENGDKYTGNWFHGCKSGQGIYVYSDSSRYEGEFKSDMRHG
jgi:hypothetical protein